MSEAERPVEPPSNQASEDELEAIRRRDAARLAELTGDVLSEDDEPPIESLAEPQTATTAADNEIAELRDELMRALAETDNVRKRAQRDLEEANKYAVTGFARGLVSVLENLQRATGSISEELRAENPQVKNLAEGVEMTMRELLSVFERYGIRRIDPMGQKFDHNYHQAMQQIEDDSVEPGTVLQVLQAGYSIHDRLLQPALVNVSKKGAGDPPPQVDQQA